MLRIAKCVREPCAQVDAADRSEGLDAKKPDRIIVAREGFSEYRQGQVERRDPASYGSQAGGRGCLRHGNPGTGSRPSARLVRASQESGGYKEYGLPCDAHDR